MHTSFRLLIVAVAGLICLVADSWLFGLVAWCATFALLIWATRASPHLSRHLQYGEFMPSELKNISKGATALLLLIAALGIGCSTIAVRYWYNLALYQAGERGIYKEERPLYISSGTLSRFGKRCSLHMPNGKSMRLQCAFTRPRYRSVDSCGCFSEKSWSIKSRQISVLHGPIHKAAISYAVVYEAKAGPTVLVDRQKLRDAAEQYFSRPPDGRFLVIIWIWMLLYFVAPLIPPINEKRTNTAV